MIKDWIYQGQKIESINDIKVHEPKIWGFVYSLNLYDKVTGELKFRYIGKKNIYSIRTKYLTKTEVASATKKSDLKRKKIKGVFKYYKTVISESDWKSYCSSNIFIKNNIFKFIIDREITHLSTNDSDLTYQEAREIMCQGTLDNELFLNDSISIRRFGKKLIN